MNTGLDNALCKDTLTSPRSISVRRLGQAGKPRTMLYEGCFWDAVKPLRDNYVTVRPGAQGKEEAAPSPEMARRSATCILQSQISF